jgi:hypothetical protein
MGDAWRELGKSLLILGAILMAAGGLLLWRGRLPLRLGHLPGDIAYSSKHGTFYFPIVTCLLVSVLLSLVFWLLGQFRR